MVELEETNWLDPSEIINADRCNVNSSIAVLTEPEIGDIASQLKTSELVDTEDGWSSAFIDFEECHLTDSEQMKIKVPISVMGFFELFFTYELCCFIRKQINKASRKQKC